MEAGEEANVKAPLLSPTPSETEAQEPSKKNGQLLFISFLLMVVVGLGNRFFNKLETIPMYNYPFFLSFYTSLVYIPLSFAYIWPMILFGNLITKEQRSIPLYKFAVMGFLDGIAGVMQVFATTNIPNGALITLLAQSAIPISMVISKVLLKIKYNVQHYTGAAVVFCGIIAALLPTFLNPDSSSSNNESTTTIIIWCGVMILSCIPMTLSSVYKEKALGEQEIDVVYLNGWVAVFQVLVSLAFAVPAAYAIGLPVHEIPENFWNGARCYVGKNSIFDGVHPDTCADAPLYVNVYIAFNVVYNILIIMILKYGSSNLLWLALTLMVPLTFALFSIPSVPGHKPIHWEHILGLVLIMIGLMIYRFWTSVQNFFTKPKSNQMGNVLN